MKIAPLLLLALMPLGCASSRSEPAPPAQAPAPDVAAPSLIAHVQEPRLTELSGLAESRRFPGCFWAHNDSGDSARLFLLDRAGATRAVVNITNAQAADWEDIAVSGSGNDASVIAADIGDNRHERAEVVLLRFRERDLKLQVLAGQDAPKSAPEIAIEAQSLKLRYPEADGAQDCESLAANARGELLLVTKSTGPSRFYVARWPEKKLDQNGEQTLKLVAEHQFGSVEPGKRHVREMLATGADLSPDESRLALITYAELYVWKLPTGDWSALDWKSVLESAPQMQALPKLPQCESVAWDGAASVLVSSEGGNPPLWKVPVPAAAAER